MDRSVRYLLGTVLGAGFGGLAAVSGGPQEVVIGSFVLYTFAFAILLRYPDAIYKRREGAAPGDAVWLAVAVGGLAVVGLPVLTGTTGVADAPMSIFGSGLFLLGIALGYWAADAEI